MKAFEISLNGCHLFTAGVDHDVSVLHSILEIHGGILNHVVRGYDLTRKEWIDWLGPQPRIGDEITIRIIKTDRVSSGQRRPLSGSPPTTGPLVFWD